MSTAATIQIGKEYFYCSSDGYPKDVIEDNLKPLIKQAKEKDKRNPDFSFIKILQMLMKDVDFENPDYCASSQYYYSIDDDGKVFVQNRVGKMVECAFVDDGMFIVDDGNTTKWKDWQQYEDVFK